MVRDIFETHPHWQAVFEVIQKLERAGYEALLAGGCVRDALLGRLAHDFDVATSATPNQVEVLFPNAIGVGRQFGVMIVPFHDFQVEVATFRQDGKYADGRHPEAVHFSSAKEDAKRRDFTVNALFYSLKSDEVVDYVGGLKDLQAKVIRAVGNPIERFTEDKLRILRAVRFAAQLDFQIEEVTHAAIVEMAPEISVVSRERITDEFRKLIKSRALARGFRELADTKLLLHIWPALTYPQVRPDLWAETLTVSPWLSASANFEMLLSWFFLKELEARESTDEKLDDLFSSSPFRLSKDEIRTVTFLVRGNFAVRRHDADAFLLLGEESGPLLTELCSLDTMVGSFPEGLVQKVIDDFLQAANEDGELPEPLLHGDDLKKVGISPGPAMGKILEKAYHHQLKHRVLNKHELLKIAEKIAKEL